MYLLKKNNYFYNTLVTGQFSDGNPKCFTNEYQERPKINFELVHAAGVRIIAEFSFQPPSKPQEAKFTLS